MAEGLYRIGECIYMEVYPPPMPYQICKIEELRKNIKGTSQIVEVAAKCFYRRKDLPANLLAAADRHALAVEEENEMDGSDLLGNQFDKLSSLQKHLIRHRELFLSRQVETYKIDMVRGKCSVSLLNELEDIRTYLEEEDTFYYSMVYDPNQKTLLVDKGEIRTGPDYQAEIPPYIDPDAREPVPHHATLVWEPNRMPDNKVEQFLVVARSIGTFARALLDGAKKPQISLRLGAAAASRDITLFHAMDTLNQNDYDITQATSCLVPRGPVLCADELEAWTQEEAKRFEDGLQEQKDFLSIQRKYLPWKPVKSIVAYYYMWKTTDRYQIQKRQRMVEKQNDLKEVIVHLRTPSGAPAGTRKDLSGKAASAGAIPKSIPDSKSVPIAPDGEKGCESCHTVVGSQWSQWGPVHERCRLCSSCYTYWRKYGGLKLPTKWEAIEKRVTGVAQITSSLPIKKPKERPAGQTRIGKKTSKKDEKRNGDIIPPLPFYMRPTGLTLYMRQKLGSTAIQKGARSSNSQPINVKNIPKPTAQDIEKYVAVHRKGHRKPRLSEPLVATLKQNVQSPIRIIRPSPTPISPSYKAKAQTNVAKSKITTAGTYVPPKSHPPGSAQPPTTAVGSQSVSAHKQQQQQQQGQQLPTQQQQQQATPSHSHQQHVSTTGIFMPPNGSDDAATNNRKRKLDQKTPGPLNPPAAKIFRPSSPAVTAPGEIFFKVDSKTRIARENLGRTNILKAARSPTKPVKYKGKGQ